LSLRHLLPLLTPNLRLLWLWLSPNLRPSGLLINTFLLPCLSRGHPVRLLRSRLSKDLLPLLPDLWLLSYLRLGLRTLLLPIAAASSWRWAAAPLLLSRRSSLTASVGIAATASTLSLAKSVLIQTAKQKEAERR
jgi:hypothetical protein